jgi:dolichyl-phosphate beta-glucosyltransferase
MEKQPKLSIIIPAYKEEDRIHLILEAIERFSQHIDYEIETIVVVDGSPDQTAKSARAFSDRLSNLKIIDRAENRGKGYSVKEGMLQAKGKYLLFSDADNSTPIEQVEKLLKYIESNEVVVGSRYSADGRLARPQPFYRIWGSRGLNLIIRLLAVPDIFDTQCGFKLFQNEAGKKIFSKTKFERFSFDIEVLALARNMGYKTKEVGITWYDNPRSTVNPIKDGFRMIRDAWQIRKDLQAGLYRED